MITNNKQRDAALQNALLSWFSKHRRDLPWRMDYTPYRTWIAEIMMQQTQMDRGVTYFLRWMERFPDIASVAEASETDLLKAWEGLGYYRRVRNIQAAARVILERHGGVFPEKYEAILDLPGIGPYTAGAIASTAFNQEVPCVDGNVERVLSRIFNIDTPVKEEPAKSQIYTLAQELIPPGKARYFNQALMELGALVCRKKAVCAFCPVQDMCEACRLGIQESRPVAGRKPTITRIEMASGVLLYNGRIFIQRRQNNDVWGGLWEFPGGCLEEGETCEQALIREWKEELGFEVSIVKPLAVLRHNYTIYRITLHCFLIRLVGSFSEKDSDGFPVPPTLSAATAWQWIPPEAIDQYPLPSPHRKLADKAPLFAKGALQYPLLPR